MMLINISMNDENELLPSIEDILIKPEDLLRDIKALVLNNRMNYLEAVVYYCQKNNYDIEAVAKTIPQSLRTLVEDSAKKLKLFKKIHNNSKSLPI